MRLRSSSADVTVTGGRTLHWDVAPDPAPGESRPMRPPAATRPRPPRRARESGAREPAQDRLEDAAVAEVGDVDLAVEARDRAEPRLPAVLADRRDGDLHPGPQAVRQPRNLERLAARQAQRGDALARAELERQDPHADEVGPMDPFVRLRDHGTDALEQRPLRGPV